MQNSRIRILWAEKVAFWEMGSWIDFEGPVDNWVSWSLHLVTDRSQGSKFSYFQASRLIEILHMFYDFIYVSDQVAHMYQVSIITCINNVFTILNSLKGNRL